MAMSKGMVLCLCVFMLVGLLTSNTNAKTIGYGAISKGGNPGCGPLHPENCHDTPANPYKRGCEREQDCRQG
jgi:hypothetical protein